MPDYTTTGLLNTVRDFGSFPTLDPNYTDARLLNFMNYQLIIDVVPLIMSCREDFFTANNDTTLTTTTSYVSIPSDAIGARVRDFTIWSNVGTAQELMVQNIPRLNPDDLAAGSSGFYVENNRLMFYPQGLYTTNTARIRYYKRPNYLVTYASGAAISAINGLTVTVNATPASFLQGVSLDCISNLSPYERLISGNIITALPSSVTITLTSTTGLTVGSYLTLAGETIVPQIPQDFISYLIQATLVKALESKNDAQYKIAVGEYLKLRKTILDLVSDRTEGENIKISSLSKLSDMIGNGVYGV